jgi:hypothetical protein
MGHTLNCLNTNATRTKRCSKAQAMTYEEPPINILTTPFARFLPRKQPQRETRTSVIFMDKKRIGFSFCFNAQALSVAKAVPQQHQISLYRTFIYSVT